MDDSLAVLNKDSNSTEQEIDVTEPHPLSDSDTDSDDGFVTPPEDLDDLIRVVSGKNTDKNKEILQGGGLKVNEDEREQLTAEVGVAVKQWQPLGNEGGDGDESSQPEAVGIRLDSAKIEEHGEKEEVDHQTIQSDLAESLCQDYQPLIESTAASEVEGKFQILPTMGISDGKQGLVGIGLSNKDVKGCIREEENLTKELGEVIEENCHGAKEPGVQLEITGKPVANVEKVENEKGGGVVTTGGTVDSDEEKFEKDVCKKIEYERNLAELICQDYLLLMECVQGNDSEGRYYSLLGMRTVGVFSQEKEKGKEMGRNNDERGEEEESQEIEEEEVTVADKGFKEEGRVVEDDSRVKGEEDEVVCLASSRSDGLLCSKLDEEELVHNECKETDLGTTETAANRKEVDAVEQELVHEQFECVLDRDLTSSVLETIPILIKKDATTETTPFVAKENSNCIDFGVNTEATPTLDSGVITEAISTSDFATNTDCIPTKDSECLACIESHDESVNTDVSMFQLLKQVQSAEKFVQMREELREKTFQLNEEKSKRMVNENLVSILQSDITSLQQRNVSESTTRIRMDGEIAELKAELEHAKKEAKEKNERVTELEESLSGTMLLVRKLEEQSSVMINKGGVDYLLQAKIADGRAEEAERTLQVLQAELLQSQSEVKRLLDRLGELSRERQEMVTSQVHTQLLQISDERAEKAERRVREMEQELFRLRSNRPHPPQMGSHTSIGPYLGSSSFLHGKEPCPTMYPATYGSSYGYSSLEYKPVPSLYTDRTTTLQPLSPPGYLGGLSIGSSRDSLADTHTSYLGDKKKTAISKAQDVGWALPKAAAGTLPNSQPGGFVNLSTDVVPSVLKPDIPSKPSKSGLRHSDPIKDELDNSLPLILPSVSMTTTPPPSSKSHDDSGHPGDGNDASDSSDWSSSEEEEVNAADKLRPTSHMNLQSKWEWLSQQKEEPPSQAPQKRPRPPPIAPKPKLFRRVSVGETNELPVSFDQPPVQPSLHSYRRPMGPQGRRLPSKPSHAEISSINMTTNY